MDQLAERQRAYEAEREERIRQMDAQFNLSIAPLREAAADAEDRMRTAARALDRHFDRRLMEVDADRTLSRESRAAHRAAVNRDRAAALNPDDVYARRQLRAMSTSSTAGILSAVDSLLGRILGGSGGGPFVAVRMAPPELPISSPSPRPPPHPSLSVRRQPGGRVHAQSPAGMPSSTVRIEELD
jgi:hypothetical protein